MDKSKDNRAYMFLKKRNFFGGSSQIADIILSGLQARWNMTSTFDSEEGAVSTITGVQTATSYRLKDDEVMGRNILENGLNEAVLMSSTERINPTAYTKFVWYKPQTISEYSVFIASGEIDNTNNVRTHAFFASRAGTLMAGHGSPSQPVYQINTDASQILAVGLWTCLALSYDGTTLRMYAQLIGSEVMTLLASVASDNVLETGPDIGGDGPNGGDGLSVRIGSWSNEDSVSNLKGSMSSILLYDRELSLEEIQTNRDVTKPSGNPKGGDFMVNVGTSAIGRLGITDYLFADVNSNKLIIDQDGNFTQVEVNLSAFLGTTASGASTGDDSGFFIDAMLNNGFYVASGVQFGGQVTFSNLDTSLTYLLRVTSSRTTSSERKTALTYNGVITEYSTSLPNGAGNTEDGAEILVTVELDGTITFFIGDIDGNTSYISGIELVKQ